MAAAAAAKEQGGVNKEGEKLFVYRISTAEEWEALQRNGSTFGGELDKTTGCFHLSNLHQVQSTLQNFFLDINRDLYLLQIDAEKISPQRETNEAQQGPYCRCYERACPVCFKRRSRHRGLLKRHAKTSAAFGI